LPSSTDPFDLLRWHLDDKFDGVEKRLDALGAAHQRHLDEHSNVRAEDDRRAAKWGGIGTAIGGAIVAILAYFGVRPQ
jgi:hypothetical protein